MTGWRRRAAAGAALVLAAVLVWFVFRPAPVRVEVGRVERGRLMVTVDEEGETRVRDRFVVTAPIAGRVARLTLEPGDPLQQGTVVARMHPVPLDPRARAEAEARLEAAQAAVREATAQVGNARAALEQAQRSAARARQLGRAGTIPEEEQELAELDETSRGKELEAAQFAERAAAYHLEAARAALMAPGNLASQAMVAACESGEPGCIELRAPVAGRVLRVPEKSERVVAPGEPLLEIGDPTALEIVVDLLSTDAVKVHPGATMLIEEWGGPAPLPARVRRVEPSGFTKVSALGVEEQRVNVIGDFTGDTGGLGDGYRVEARIVVAEADDVLLVPSSALFRRQDAWHVFAVVDGRATLRQVEIGRGTPQQTELLGGLAAGDAVVLHPSDQVADGVRVAPL
ncbi:MAG TPA: HlyD family efflux transporter periplasmic adaptor subunit [Candidatus Dormibacteraeota bacterium]|nr:HlyD family efflux transporter periplasmic adaptor subunit [Candidatus Dormibacteraeota bacterium]